MKVAAPLWDAHQDTTVVPSSELFMRVFFSAQVVHNGQKTKLLSMRTGVRKGCLLSPLLFLVALD